MTLIDDYLLEQDKYTQKYGERTIVLMQVGHFYECYGVDNEIEKSNSDNLYTLSNILDIQLTRKNKNIKESSRKNPLMIGVNIFSVDKYIQLLINNNYTTVLIEQISEPPFVERKVTNIYSPGTNVKYNLKGDTNNLMCIYVENSKPLNYSKKIMCIGVSVIDLSTGKNSVHEIFSKQNDINYGLDEIFRYVQTYDPKEIVFIKKNIEYSNDFLNNYLDFSQRVVHFKEVGKDIDSCYFDLHYQSVLLEKIFKNPGLLSIIEYLDLETRPFGLISYILVLDFAYEHSSTIVSKISKPEIKHSKKYMSLTNNTINQLNLIHHHSQGIVSNKFNSLFSVVNNTSTPIGKRLLRDKLLNPVIDPIYLNSQYDYIESMMNPNNCSYKVYEKCLIKIQDLERIHRKIALQILQPSDFIGIDFSYEHINKMLSIENDNINTLRPSKETIVKFNDFIKTYTSDFNMNEIVKFHIDKITSSFFNKGVVAEIDEVQTKIDNCHFIYNKLINKLSHYIDVTKGNMLKLDSNDRDGYYIALTSKRSESLKKELKKQNYPTLNIKFSNKHIEFDTSNLEYKVATKPNVKIMNEYLKNLSHKLKHYEMSLHTLCKNKFLERLEYYDSEYGETLKIITHYVSEIDCIKSNAKTATMYGYVRPNIDSSHEHSFINTQEIRHPIIERINTETNYVPNDVKIGINNDITGMLLFGTNASGKSSLMKAIGLNIIMAQAGFFVAAKKFCFSPYEYLFTRINNNDNIFKGESSFAVEMGELRSILKRANNKSLILGDELCSGTENISALAIFSSSVIKLDERKSNFVFATHLHDLCKIPQINTLESIKMFHLKVLFNEETGELMYDRKLEPGNGPTIYGLEVCRAMDMDNDFLKLSEQIRKQILGKSDTLIEQKKSNYNAQVYVDDCNICSEKAEDVHHIKFQCTASPNNIIDSHIVKDVKSNLVPLCKKCHNAVHNGNLLIRGYIKTSNGVQLDFEHISQSKLMEKRNNNKKIDPNQIMIITNLKRGNSKITTKNALAFLEKNHNIKLSGSTYSKIIKGKY